ncbi:DUF6588 family protein [Hufsiella ginkgonis]|uniref:Uncharacterized protein n=1 Tax=Hufsiella ginkgonis TaxID=2695274 RepID=A0A7K1XXT9_9SPHI|nr:DUF6588 family protein [Hufsiella ginkgonis]MXV15825.1 hypothetical protein [Hufsiella ginkgonis]
MKKSVSFFAICLLVSAGRLPVFAQGDLSELIKSGPADATRLAAAYLDPLFKGFGVGLNSGWMNTGRTKQTGHIEIRLSGSGAFVPKDDKTFDVTTLGLSNKIALAPGSGPTAQTFFGRETAGPTMQVKDNSGNVVETFSLPKGTGIPLVPAPQLQVTLGLPKNFDVTARYIPETKLGDDFGKVSLIGGGVKFEVLPLLNKTADRILPFNVAVGLGYTRLKYTYDLDINPPGGSAPKDISQVKDFSGQRVDASFSGFNADAIISKKLLFFTPFFSVGYNSSKTNVGLVGNYPLVTDVVLGVKQYTTFTDPVSIKQKDVNGLKSTVGFQLDMAFLKFYGSFTAAQYKLFNAGIGIGI